MVQQPVTGSSGTGHIVTVTDDTFVDSVLAGERPVLVDFWAPWCPPCLVLSPILEDLAEEFGDRILIAKLNSDENPRTTIDYGVMSMPTMLVFRRGEVIGSVVGARPKAALRQLINGYLVSA